MNLFSKWYQLSIGILIVFTWGGLWQCGLILFKSKSINTENAKIDIKLFRSAIFLLFLFVILVTIGWGDLFIKSSHIGVYFQIINNFLIGVVFIISLKKLWKAIKYDA